MMRLIARIGSNKLFLFIGFGILLLLLAAVSIMVGRYPIPPRDFAALLTGEPAADSPALILFKVRISRICAALLIGGALAMSGAAYQGMLKNPMVSPDILGASAGAGFGASLGISLGLDGLTVQVLAFLFGMLAVAATFWLSRAIEGMAGGGMMVLVLTGMVLSALFSAFVSIVKYVADPYDVLPQITFWLMGGLSYITAADLLMLAIPFLLGAVPMLFMRWRLNVLSIGDQEASAMGLNVPRLRAWFVLCATLLTSSAVAVGGMIGWVGLIIPHLARMLVGVNNRYLLPASLMLGGGFLLIVDDLARSLLPQEIPLSVITAILGAPVFLHLLFIRQRS